MLTFYGSDARTALISFYGSHAAAFPQLLDVVTGTDMLASIIEGMEALYAWRAELPEDGIELLDALGRFVSAHNFHGKAVRAGAIAGVASRMAAGGDAVAEGDPDVDPAFMPVAPDPTPEP